MVWSGAELKSNRTVGLGAGVVGEETDVVVGPGVLQDLRAASWCPGSRRVASISSAGSLAKKPLILSVRSRTSPPLNLRSRYSSRGVSPEGADGGDGGGLCVDVISEEHTVELDEELAAELDEDPTGVELADELDESDLGAGLDEELADELDEDPADELDEDR